MEATEIERELERCHPAAFGWALHCCGWDKPAAEDALQASYLKVLSGRARFAGRSSFRTWLFGVIRNTAAAQRRKRGLSRMLPLSALNGRWGSGRSETESRLEASQEVARLRKVLGRLPERQRELLHLVFYQDMTIAEAADVLEIAVGTARTHYERGKARLRALLSEERR